MVGFKGGGKRRFTDLTLPGISRGCRRSVFDREIPVGGIFWTPRSVRLIEERRRPTSTTSPREVLVYHEVVPVVETVLTQDLEGWSKSLRPKRKRTPRPRKTNQRLKNVSLIHVLDNDLTIRITPFFPSPEGRWYNDCNEESQTKNSTSKSLWTINVLYQTWV